MSHSLIYLDYCKRRLVNLIPLNTPYCFFNPIIFRGIKIYQVRISTNKIVGIYDGVKWQETECEDLLETILVWFEVTKGKVAIQKALDFAEAI